MKNILKSTTVLAAAGLIALSGADASAQSAPEKLKLSLGGFFGSWVGYAENDSSFENAVNAHYGSINMENDSEVFFVGDTTLDNGINVSVVVELETDQANANTGSVLDETYLKLSGSFGSLLAGSTVAAGDALANFAPSAGVLGHNGDDFSEYVINPTGTGTPDVEIGDDTSMKLVYYTPTFSGFQAGVTYVPSTSNSDTPPITGGAASGTTAEESWADIALAYSGTAGAVDFSADAGYWVKGGSTDQEGYRVGANVVFSGFTVGGAYADVDNEIGNITSATSVSDYKAYDLGVSYETGPWVVALSYYHTESPLSSATAGDDETTHYMVSGTYAIGPGVSLGANIFMAEYDDETTAAASNNEGWGVVGGIMVEF